MLIKAYLFAIEQDKVGVKINSNDPLPYQIK